MKDRFARAIYNASYKECPSIYQELVDSILSLFEEELAQSNSQLLDTIEKEIQPLLPDHICRFNDGECECNCYKEAVEAINTLINNLKKGLK